MKEISCNIIKDLLPSYVDNICSEDSRHLIEKHISGCEQCRTQLELLKSTELTDERGEQKRISYLKKIKRHYDQGIVRLIILTLMVIGGFLLLVSHDELAASPLFYSILPLMLMAAYCLMPDSPLADKRSKLSVILVIGSMLVSIFMISYYIFLVFRWNILIEETKTGPFGIPYNEIGPYLEKWLVFIAIVQLGIFILSNILIFRGYRIHRWIYGLTLTGFSLAAGYICTLHNMSTAEELYRRFVAMTIYIMIEGTVCSVAAYVFAKKVLPQIRITPLP